MAIEISLDGRTALVTGAARGLGCVIAEWLARAGAEVWLNDLGHGHAARAADAFAARDLKVRPVAADVSDRGQVARMAREIEQQGAAPDILVNNAGIGDFVGWREITEAKWQAMLSVHLTGSFNCCHVFLPAMVARGWGRVINISSVAGKRGDYMGNAHYTAAKAGIVGLTKSLAADVAASGVTVNAVAPGLVETALTDEMSPELKAATEARIAAGRLGLPGEVAAAVAFLASEHASYIVGETLSVNGGSYMD